MLSNIFYYNALISFLFVIFSTLPVILGCSSDGGMRGYTCSDGCRQEVELVGSGKRRVCVRCCTGNECNKIGGGTDNETAVVEAGARDKMSDTVELQTSGGSGVTMKNEYLVMIVFFWTVWLFKSRVDLQS